MKINPQSKVSELSKVELVVLDEIRKKTNIAYDKLGFHNGYYELWHSIFDVLENNYDVHFTKDQRDAICCKGVS